jgi:hypothetical protein
LERFFIFTITARYTRAMSIKNNKPQRTYVIVCLIVIHVFSALPYSFSQPTDGSPFFEPQLSALQRQQQEINSVNNTVHITKSSTSSYNIVDSQTGLVGAFDTLYLITGSSDSLDSSKKIIISTIQDDFDNSPTIGYIRLDNVTEEIGGASLPASIVNPFADQQMINSTIAQHITSAIDSAHSLNNAMVAIKCDFGMIIKEWQCNHHGIF